MSNNRAYHSLLKKDLATAYGYAKADSFVARLRKELHRLTDEQIQALGEWQGNGLLLPRQVEIIVIALGEPSKPAIVYTCL